MNSSDLLRHGLLHRGMTSFRLAFAMSLSATVCAPAALAAPRCMGHDTLVPVSFDGVYVNLASGLQTPTSAGNPGWDFNPFYSGSPPSVLSFAIQASPAGMLATNGVIMPVPLGFHVGPSSTFLSGIQTSAAAMAAYRAGAGRVQFLGIRFENAGNIHYGSVEIETTGPAGNPARLVQSCFEMLPNTLHPAGDGSYPVTLQQFSID